MPISSGFTYYRTNSLKPKPIVRPQICTRAPKFRENQRNKKQNGLFTTSKSTAGSQLPPTQRRSTAVVRQPLRSDTFTLPTKRDETTNIKVPKITQIQNGSRQTQTINKSSPTQIMRKNGHTRSTLRQSNPIIDRQNLERKPVRFAYNNNHHHNNNTVTATHTSSAPISSSSAYYQKTEPFERAKVMPVTNDDYRIYRQRDLPAYAYNDYHTVSDIPNVSYGTSLPPISQTTYQRPPTVIIHSNEPVRSDPPKVVIRSKEHTYTEPPTIIRTISAIPSYSTSNPYMMLPSSIAPGMVLPNTTLSSYPAPHPLVVPNTTIPSYLPNSPMFIPTTTVPSHQPLQTFFLPPPPPPVNPSYIPQPFFYPYMPPKPMVPSSAPPPPPAPPSQQTIINQSSTAAPTTVKTEHRIEENNPTIILDSNSINNNKKNVTIQLKMLDEDIPRSERFVHVVRDPPYRQTAVIRRPPITNEYIYVDPTPSTTIRRPPHRSEIVYVDRDRPLEYEEEYVYVDDHNNHIEYIYDDTPVYPRRYPKRYYQPSSTNIVYE